MTNQRLHNFPEAEIIKELKISDVPKGAITRYWLQIVSDGMGVPIQVPVIVARGNEDGKILGLTAAVHGNELNGIPATGDKFLQRDILKGEWKYPGFVVSDWASIEELKGHGFAVDDKHAGEIAVNAGSDMDMEAKIYVKHLKELVQEGKVDLGACSCQWIAEQMEKSPDLKKGIKIVWESNPIPHAIWAINSTSDEKLFTDLDEALNDILEVEEIRNLVSLPGLSQYSLAEEHSFDFLIDQLSNDLELEFYLYYYESFSK